MGPADDLDPNAPISPLPRNLELYPQPVRAFLSSASAPLMSNFRIFEMTGSMWLTRNPLLTP